MNSPTLLRSLLLASITAMATACANGGGVRSGSASETVTPAAPASTGTAQDTAGTAPAADVSGAVATDAGIAGIAGNASLPRSDAASANTTPNAAEGGAPTQAEQDYSAIYGTPYDPIADPTLPAAAAVPLSFDPWEKLNRKVYKFNGVVDRNIARPLAIAYQKVVPDPVRRGVGNFFDNLGQPVTIVNELLQGKPRDAAASLGRFALNSTVGIAGIFDPATKVKIKRYDEDFGQTLGKWGWKRSRYVVLPLFGPRTLRDAFGVIGDAQLSPVLDIEDDKTRIFLQGLQLVNVRTQLLPLDNLTVGATDEYALVRDSWLQRRDYQVTDGRDARDKDGKTTLPDYLMEDESNPGAPASSMPIIPGSNIR